MQTVKETVVVAVQSGAQKMAEAWEGSKEQLAAAVGAGAADVAEGQESKEEEEGGGEQPPPREADEDLGKADWGSQGQPGPLEKMRESAVHAVEGFKMRLHLGTHQPTAEERTGESMHMAKAAEGCNTAQDPNPIDSALHDALRPEKGERPEASDFPETLGDALAAAQMRDLPQAPPSPTKAIQAALGEAESSGAGPAPANPFSAGARSKL